ncbi:hypothetical protein [Lactiplantibacillus carotarum]|uniref:hypothetical protein n=1 Tax=Lactiplantibacillus carotarum TaxID=2993456 RepID=UPI00298EEBBF|nr:hypothetical protein [Lactiplantibacillus carotarum]
MAQTEAQKRAQQKYNQKHKQERKITSYRNSARMFIRRYATDEDLHEFEALIVERRRINLLLQDLDGVRAYINDPDFLAAQGLQVEIWRRPEDLLADRQLHGDTSVDWERWLETHILPRFSREEPVVEIIKAGHHRYYDGFRGYDILNWLAGSED